MRLSRKFSLIAGLSVAALVAGIPATGQERPESILPPGFGDPEPPRPSDPRPAEPRPAEPRPSNILPPRTDAPDAAPSDPLDTSLAGGDETQDGEQSGEESLDTASLIIDIPPQARRSTANIGILNASDGDMGATAFGGFNGRYLSVVMRHIEAPLVSRWGSIVLRRALLSRVDTPRDVNGADWAAERVWLLLRMGEAEAARQLVQAVDVDQYTPKMFQMGMQAALATADPIAMCPMADFAEARSKEPAWPLARAMCSGLAGESAQAVALIDRARDTRLASGIDLLLAEKVVGAGEDTRRAVSIQWDGVNVLTSWRFGLAGATAVELPPALLASARPHVRAWHARLPLLPFEKRLESADIAAALGVFSSAVLVDFYGATFDESDPADRGNKPADQLRQAYAAASASERIAAMKALWAVQDGNPLLRYARTILTARAAALIPVTEDNVAESEPLVASMLSAGLDLRAARWAALVEENDQLGAWALLAVGSPRAPANVSAGRISDVGEAAAANGDRKAALLFAGLAGLGRIPANDLASMADQFNVPITRQNKWTQALDRAVAARAPAAVALLCAVGMQADSWAGMPPAHLYRIVSALRQVGYEAEARMIAAEALTRV